MLEAGLLPTSSMNVRLAVVSSDQRLRVVVYCECMLDSDYQFSDLPRACLV